MSLLEINREIVDSKFEKCMDYENGSLQTELSIESGTQLKAILESYVQKKESKADFQAIFSE